MTRKIKTVGHGLDRNHFAQIHIAQAQLGLDDANYRALLMRATGVSTSRDLDIDGFNAVMDEFTRLGFVSTATRERQLETSRAPGHSTNAQRALIRRLWRAYTGRNDDRGLSRWLMKKWTVSHVKFLSADQAQKAIGALRNFKTPHSSTTESKGD